ncbi:hypothetical protein TNCV_3806041 [Trichonephila clavipes]|nr:hypothetical protein TNCV_3806041 [Trichonephila clavipes]
MDPQLARALTAVSGRRISRQTLYSRLAETVLDARRQVSCVPLTASNRKDRIFVKLKTSVVDTTRIRECSFQ